MQIPRSGIQITSGGADLDVVRKQARVCEVAGHLPGDVNLGARALRVDHLLSVPHVDDGHDGGVEVLVQVEQHVTVALPKR